MKRKSSSTRRLLNLKSLSDTGLIGFNNHHLTYFSITPYNLSVLSQENIEAKIFALMNLTKGTEIVEILCLNSRENFRFNKSYMKWRIAEEQNPKIKQLLIQDLEFIDQIQSTTATSRSFLICIRSSQFKEQTQHHDLYQLEKALNQYGLTLNHLTKDELKTLLAVYYEQNVTTDKFEDVDGERWLT